MHHNSLVISETFEDLQRGLIFKVAPFRVQTSKDHLGVEDTFDYHGDIYEITNIEAWGWNATERELTVKLIAKKNMKTGNTKKTWEVQETSYLFHLIKFGLKDKEIVNLLTNMLLTYRTGDSIAKQCSEVRKYVSYLNGQTVAIMPTGDNLLVIQKAASEPVANELLPWAPKPGETVKIWATRNRPAKVKIKTDAELFDAIDTSKIPVNEAELKRFEREQAQPPYTPPVGDPVAEPTSISAGNMKIEDLPQKSQALVEKIANAVSKLPKGEAALMMLAKALGVKEYEHKVIITKFRF